MKIFIEKTSADLLKELDKLKWKPVGDAEPREEHFRGTYQNAEDIVQRPRWRPYERPFDLAPRIYSERAKRFFKFVLFKRDLDMPKVHFVKKARKANKALGIKKGQSYWWWKNRLPGSASGVKRVSFSPPKPSQVAGNPFTSQVLSLGERLEELVADESLADEIVGIASDVRQLADEQQEKYDNMPESLQSGPTGELLKEREEALNAWADELESIEVGEEVEQLEEALLEAQETAYQGN